MKTISLSAHFDGKYIRLDEPFELVPNSRLLVTVLPNQLVDEVYQQWLTLSQAGLAAAYDDNEDGYSLTLIKEVNPDYEGG